MLSCSSGNTVRVNLKPNFGLVVFTAFLKELREKQRVVTARIVKFPLRMLSI